MSDKSYVTMATHVCVVCGVEYETGELLLDRRLRKSFERRTCTGRGICPTHQKMIDDGFIHLVVVSNEHHGEERLNPAEAIPTGDIMHIKREVAQRIFNVEIERPVLYIEPAVFDVLRERYVEDVGHEPTKLNGDER